MTELRHIMPPLPETLEAADRLRPVVDHGLQLCRSCEFAAWIGEQGRLRCESRNRPAFGFYCPMVSACKTYLRATGSN